VRVRSVLIGFRHDSPTGRAVPSLSFITRNGRELAALGTNL